jgi:hypothetical protein
MAELNVVTEYCSLFDCFDCFYVEVNVLKMIEARKGNRTIEYSQNIEEKKESQVKSKVPRAAVIYCTVHGPLRM